MPLDPIVSLSVALAEAPGSCACLLGAGVSVDAQIPTAWDIRQDGFRKLYRQETGSDTTPTDEQLTQWLQEHGHGDLDYSSLLDQIAPDPAVRRELLAGYFKAAKPGQAHERLADLAADGYVRVFITTNFDRLLEDALTARGISPVVVSDDGTLANAPRREHADAFIVKVHGDYMQETIRNTPTELAELPPELTTELRAIVDHYGLLIIGWRGADPALAAIVRARSPSRYGVWWLSRSDPPADPGTTVIDAVGARLIVRPDGAGAFLGELGRRLTLYAAHPSGDDPGSIHDQVLSLIKRSDDIDLDELLRRERFEFESVVQAVRAEMANTSGADTEGALAAWARLAAATDRRLASLIPLALHRPELLAAAIQEHVEWVPTLPAMGGLMAWVEAWVVPFWMIGMILGGLAVHLDRYEALRPLLTATWLDPNRSAHAFVSPSGELGEWVGAQLGPDPPPRPHFRAWGWLPHDVRAKDWLGTRYRPWLGRDDEPERAFTKFSVLLHIATGLRDEHAMTPWWTLDEPTSEGYAQRLHDNPALRAQAAEAVGATLEDFNAKAPDILRSLHGMSAFPRPERTANMLEFGSYAAPPREGAAS
ncbi:MAG TPA: SIR2 family protein [Solirubrobacteraceae bacterium]|jgi:hypothetical protein|nr:SIR2 family protein [Solirubrobacteraceae bacterium]